jgi:hypothetical protein
MIVAGRSGLAAGFVQQRSEMDLAAAGRRWCRDAGEAQRPRVVGQSYPELSGGELLLGDRNVEAEIC